MTTTQTPEQAVPPEWPKPSKDHHRPAIKIYGERNTGTNYLTALLHRNFDCRLLPGFVPRTVLALELVTPGRENVRDFWFRKTFSRNLGWKHMKVQPLQTLQSLTGLNKPLCLLTLSKNPYSWLLSMYRRPYHQYGLDGCSFEKFLKQPWQLTDRDNVTDVDDVVQLWNLKNQSYLDLGDHRTVLRLNYETVLADPERALQKIEQQFHLRRRSEDLTNHERSTKDRGRSSNDYRSYYLNEQWRSGLSAEAVAWINERLDHQLVSALGYEVLCERDFR